MNPVLAILLGNTTAALSLVRSRTPGRVRRVPVAHLERLRPYLAAARHGRVSPLIIVGSVNPPALERLRKLLDDMAYARPLVAREDFSIPIETSVDRPERVGVDRLLGAVAARERARGACIVVDCGTAITVNSVNARGVFLGGAIFPGLSMMAEALAEGTAQLPHVVPAGRVPVIGRSTEGAMIAGVLSGAAGAVTNLIAQARKVVGDRAHVFLSGGDAKRLAGLLPRDCCDIAANLVLEGLILAYRGWHKQ
jgi:type III pantothenate kinase